MTGGQVYSRSDHNPTKNLMMVYVFYNILMFLEGNILLGGLKLGDEVLDLSVVDVKYSACRADGYFILDGGHEC